ncbi:hypothetical protein M670_02379 [Schinkia azotoformans MEV2011]|uniref:Uncharacterized protein n=1 Tax=Schinkia azotoformans MEV2011 TaxID=1348973 RepID=A0A072NN26_SCHAZ|nr:hypothetical protein [Schinkia azotoformans]KEF38338.1 hypothetical protein M670_02379 [Schinkia azotoformans MEV2011]MEC1694081.1 hypothetical protein [Schinkia azotoformans]MEC1715793.1 hypothetical protein [Schinkia azotoformans]MEC1724914.1 hypothetical protein [Schinkia azotoformans]MEC1741432.1 hypothetical protein [Schinkia azotoformans]
MIFRLFLFLLGFGLAVVGGVTVIAYLNVMAMGLSFLEYLLYISTRMECYLLMIGIMLITISIYIPLNDKNRKK